MIEKAKFKTLC